MRLKDRAITKDMNFVSKEEMTKWLDFTAKWWVEEFAKWNVTDKEFYSAVHEMSAIVFNIWKKTGWRDIKSDSRSKKEEKGSN